MVKLFNSDYKEIIKDIKCDLIITDPPYLYERGGGSKIFDCDALERKDRIMENSDFGKEQIYEFMNISKQCMSNPQWYIFCSEKQLPFYLDWCVENKFLFNLITLEKQLSILNRKRLSTNTEFVLRVYNWGCIFNKSENNSDYNRVIKFNRIKKQDKLYKQQKPTEIIDIFTKFGSNEGDIIFDPFMGSGSVGESSLNNNRGFIGIEIDENRYNISNKRLSKLKKEE